MLLIDGKKRGKERERERKEAIPSDNLKSFWQKWKEKQGSVFFVTILPAGNSCFGIFEKEEKLPF